MILRKSNKKEIKAIAEKLSTKLIKQPIFMFFCQDISKRKAFIKSFFEYYIPEWQKEELIFTDESKTVLVTLTDPKNFKYKFKGLKAYKIRKHKTSASIFMHRENMEDICDILVPPSKKTRFLTIYANPEQNFDQVVQVVDEVVAYADKEGISLMYETFSRKYLGFMDARGFAMCYRKQFLNTQFVEAIMIKEPQE